MSGGASGGARRLRLRVLLSALVVLAIFAFLGRTLARDWGAIRDTPWKLSPAPLVLSFALLGLYYPLLVGTWCLLMRLLGQPVPFRRGLAIWLGSQMGKYLPGKVWSVIGRVVLGERAGLDPVRVSVSLFVELGLNIVTGLLLAAVTLSLGGGIPMPGRWVLVAAIPVGLVALHPRAFGPLVNLGLRVLKREPFPLGWPAKSQAALIGLYALGWLVYGAAFYLLLLALGVPMHGPGGHVSRLLFVTGLNAVSWVIGFLAFVAPGGLGVREASLAWFLGFLLAAPTATLVALVARVWITLAEVVIVATGWILGRGGRA